MGGRSSGRPFQRAVLSVDFGRPGGRPEAPTVGFSTVGGRPGGRPAGLTDPNGYIFLAYKLGVLVIVLSQDFRRALSQFFPLFSEVFLHKIESKYFLSKGKILTRVFKVIL